MHESFEAGYLSDKLDAAWARRVHNANEWNARLASGEVHPGLWKRISWSARALFSGHYQETILTLERHWRETDGRREPSLVWALNDVFASQFWIGGLFKVRVRSCLDALEFIDTCIGIWRYLSTNGTPLSEGITQCYHCPFILTQCLTSRPSLTLLRSGLQLGKTGSLRLILVGE